MTAEEGGAEASVPVNVLLPWLGWIDRDEVARLLTGCELDDGHSDEFLPIESYDGAAATVTLVGGRRLSLRRVSNGAIVDRRPGWPLLAAIEGAKTPLERREAQVQKQLRLRRLDPNSFRSAEDREQVLGFLELVEKGGVPAEPALRAFTEAMKPSGLGSRAPASCRGAAGGDGRVRPARRHAAEPALAARVVPQPVGPVRRGGGAMRGTAGASDAGHAPSLSRHHPRLGAAGAGQHPARRQATGPGRGCAEDRLRDRRRLGRGEGGVSGADPDARARSRTAFLSLGLAS